MNLKDKLKDIIHIETLRSEFKINIDLLGRRLCT